MDINLRVPPNFSAYRANAHRAVQHLTKAARANLPAKDDDSHSNIGWDKAHKAFLTHAMDGVYVGLCVNPFCLFIRGRGGEESSFSLNGKADAEASVWLDKKLTANGLDQTAPIGLPYDLPADVEAISSYAEGIREDGFAALAVWYDVANSSLNKLVERYASLSPGPSPVRCWPHHFDMATYVSLEEGNPETARGIGVGLSPGDESYGEPYVYINPWPHLNVDTLPSAVEPGHWHTEGFVGLIATASELTASTAPKVAFDEFVKDGFAIALASQGF